MSPHRYPPVTTLQAIMGGIGLLIAVGVVVGLSELLLLPAEDVPDLPPPELEEPDDDVTGEITCPSGESLEQRPDPMPVKSAELIECPELFDGEHVRYEGEVVGEVLLRPTHAWIHVNDDLYGVQIGPVSEHRTVAGGNSGMAVSVPREVGMRMVPGGFRRAGTGVAVVGTYLRADPEDGGAPSIRADDLRIVRGARALEHAVSGKRLTGAAVMATIALLLLGRWAAVRRRTD